MGCPDVSGIISNILLAVEDEANATYSSGQVNQMIFKSLPTLNGIMGVCFSGTQQDGCIYPSISGTVYVGILEALVAKDLTKKTLTKLARTYNITSFKEGDSTVTVGDASRSLADLYKVLSDEFDELVRQTKFTLVNGAPCSIQGTDGQIPDNWPGNNNPSRRG